MSTATQTLEPEGPALAVVCIGAVIVASVLEASANNGWPLPLPTAWCLLAVLVGARFGGLAGGMWSAVVMLAYAVHTSGFTTGHTAASLLWGQGSDRTVAFGLAALVLVALVQNQRSLSLPALKALPVRSSRWRVRHGGGDRDANPDLGGAADLERRLAVLCSVARRSANELNERLAQIRRHCDDQPGEMSNRGEWRESQAVIAAAAARCSLATATLLTCVTDYGDPEGEC